MMKHLRHLWRFLTLDDRPMDEQWRPIEDEPTHEPDEPDTSGDPWDVPYIDGRPN